MAKKIMLWPSARSKFVKDNNMKLIFSSLLFIAVVMIVQNYYIYSFMYAVKLLLMIVVSYYATRETEILFYVHDKDITRVESKALIEKSYWRVTAMIYVLLIPLGTPLWLVAIGAAMASLFGKLLFGGFHHMVFHSSLVGVIMVTLGWRSIENRAIFAKSLDNDIMTLIFDRPFFNETLSIGNMFDPANYLTSLEMLKLGQYYEFLDVLFGAVPGIIVSGVLLLIVLAFLIYKKAVNYVTPLALIGSFFITASIFGLVQEQAASFALFHLFSGSLLFVTVFVATDPITSPMSNGGKIVYGVVAGALTMVIRNGAANSEGIIFGVLFMQMLTPMVNTWFNKKKKVVKKPVKKEAV